MVPDTGVRIFWKPGPHEWMPALANVPPETLNHDPRKGSISIAPAKPAPEPPGPKLTKSVVTSAHFLGGLTAPLYALLNTRNARGTYAQIPIDRL